MLRVLVFGSRDWLSYDIIRRDMWFLREKIGPYVTVHGACPSGADVFADMFAKHHGWEVEPHPADWNAYGRRAGPIRNKAMADTYPDYAMGYILGASNGSMNMREHLVMNHIPTRITTMNIDSFAGFPEGL